MSTKITQLLENAIQSLVAENKQPTVALVKSRLAEPVPMPLIIQSLQRFKKTGFVPKIERVEKTFSTEERLIQLEQQVIALSKRIEELEQNN